MALQIGFASDAPWLFLLKWKAYMQSGAVVSLTLNGWRISKHEFKESPKLVL